MSEQTKYSAALRAAPNQSKKPSNVLAVNAHPKRRESKQIVDPNILGCAIWGIGRQSQSGYACAEPSSRPSAPRSGGRA